MPWVRLDDGFADHPKIERVGPLAAWLHVTALCYSARHLTDGRIPRSKALRLADIASPEDHIGALLRAGLWHEDGDDYVIHDYLEYQPARSEVEKERAQARDRMKRHRQRSPEVPANTGRSSPTPSRPVPSPGDPVSRLPRNSRRTTPPVDNSDSAPAHLGDLLTNELPTEVWERFAEHKLAHQPPGRVGDPASWKATTSANARQEHAERATRWWADYDVTPDHLARCLVDGKAPAASYRRTASP